MEAKILAATLASLAAIFAGLNGGAFTADDIRNTDLANEQLTQESGLQSMLPDIPFIDQLNQKPEPTNKVKAQIQIQDSSDLKLKQATLQASSLKQIQTKNIDIQSDEEIKFKQFKGRLKFDNTSTIKGTAKAINTSGVNITTGIRLNTEADTDKINVENTQRSEMKFSKASIKPTNNSDFGINTNNTNLNINSFTGDITVHTRNKTLIIDGKVDTLKAGKYSLGN
ncbi:hypothetical protein [Candidatus Nanohalobium constans]|uniref:Adhesin domain-containing protein n=1 Tax=Candidatus Nanohalobium constans TaxID=2565781 RepID=A0A5Q0UG25_9ARCH|nr:hypothetical protein [Candidatus Nanohalobium constans]QGA80351.1 hypothetical protein LC1Nh_0450 [Candidatus Nanohalobium constans]